jgi:putative transposase
VQELTTEADSGTTRSIIRELLQGKILEVVETVIEAELTTLLGRDRYERTGEPRGHRNGARSRAITTEHGPLELSVPRARVVEEGGKTKEFHSSVLPRYARRSRRVDEAILGVYLGGANTRRIRKALEPLLGPTNLSKSAISRVVGRLRGMFTSWSARDLTEERYPVLYLDGMNLKVRMARRVVSVPVLVVLGVDPEGRKRLVSLRLAARESGGTWTEVVEDLQRRGLPAPQILISDGHRGLRKALEQWPEAQVQRCTVHKWSNLKEHSPKHVHRELQRDYHRIVYARDGLKAREAWTAFVSKWSKLSPAVVESLEEAGEQLLTYYEFPRGLWKSLRTTNPIENLNREFRRRTKTQGSFSTEEAGVTLLYGLIAFGQIRMRKIDGYPHLVKLVLDREAAAA